MLPLKVAFYWLRFQASFLGVPFTGSRLSRFFEDSFCEFLLRAPFLRVLSWVPFTGSFVQGSCFILF